MHAIASRLSLDPTRLDWEIEERLDRKRSTLFPLLLLDDLREQVATAYYKKPYFPGARQASRNLPRARAALEQGEVLGTRFADLARDSGIAINETLALNHHTLEVITFGLDGRPMGNPLAHAYGRRARAAAVLACARVGRAIRIIEELPGPADTEAEGERIWEEATRKLKPLSKSMNSAELARLRGMLRELFTEGLAEPDAITYAHGDLSTGNVILMDDNTGLIDFMWIPQLKGFDLARFVHRLRYTTVSLRPWTEALVEAVLDGYGDTSAPDLPGWRFTEMQRLMSTARSGRRRIPIVGRPARRALEQVRAQSSRRDGLERGGDPATTPFVFFVGTNGSGTTLHRAIFDSHPDLAIPGEARFVAKLASHRDRYETAGFDADRFLRDLGKQDRFGNWGLDLADVALAIEDPEVKDFSEAIRRLYRLFAHQQGKTRYGDKTQANIHNLELLAELFPEARFVHAVRDGRDVALAHTDGTKIEQVAVSWKRRVSAGREAGAMLGPERYIESRFEELIDDPETAIRRLCEFTALPFDARMLKYYERAGDIVATTAVPDRHKDIFLPPTKGLKDWRRDLSDDQVARFEALAGDLLGDLGYPRKFDRVPLAARIAAWRQLTADGAGYLTRRVRKTLGR